MYLKSEYINVFPSVGRQGIDPESQLSSEGNLSRLIRNLYRRGGDAINKDDKGSFVVSREGLVAGSEFEFVIYGFYFKVLAEGVTSLLEQNANDIYAVIKITSNTVASNNTTTYQNLKITSVDEERTTLDTIETLDTNGEFIGVEFVSDISNISEGYHYLKIWDATEQKTPDSSKLYWNLNDIAIDYNPQYDLEYDNASYLVYSVTENNSTDHATLNITQTNCKPLTHFEDKSTFTNRYDDVEDE